MFKQGVFAGLFYFAFVFLAGIALGTVRNLYGVPFVGQSLAVAIELPFMLAIAWQACRWLMVKFEIDTLAERAAMGALAMGLLLAAEWGFRIIFNQLILGIETLPSAIATQSFADGLSLAAQIAFGMLPLIMRTDSPQATWPKPPSR